jgi:hypothetical protein
MCGCPEAEGTGHTEHGFEGIALRATGRRAIDGFV